MSQDFAAHAGGNDDDQDALRKDTRVESVFGVSCRNHVSRVASLCPAGGDALR